MQSMSVYVGRKTVAWLSGLRRMHAGLWPLRYEALQIVCRQGHVPDMKYGSADC